MIQEEEPHSLRSCSETHTNTSKEQSISSPSKECTVDSSSTLEQMLPLLLEIFSQLIHFLKEPSFQTSKESKEIEDPLPEHQEHHALLSDTSMRERKQELDSQVDAERLSRVLAEQWLASVLEAREPISHF